MPIAKEKLRPIAKAESGFNFVLLIIKLMKKALPKPDKKEQINKMQ